jgi:hypothetical protein
MKDIVFSAMLIAVGAIGLMNVDGIRQLYVGAYPTSIEKRQALDRCALGGTAFDRLDAAEREACYARQRVAPPSVQPLGPSRMPHEDVRRTQGTQR